MKKMISRLTLSAFFFSLFMVGANARNTDVADTSGVADNKVKTALGISRDRNALSYSVQELNYEDINSVKDANFINAVGGKVSGVIVNPSSSGIGGASKVYMRGIKSMSHSSNVLYVIDGMPMYNFGGGGAVSFDCKGATESIADLNPEDIESLSVLTGAAAAALYGHEAANGAIIINTKKGHSGKLRATFSSTTEFASPFVMPEFQNRYSVGSEGVYIRDYATSWGAEIPESERRNHAYQDFLKTGHVYTNTLSISGGSEHNQTYFSAAATNSDGIIPNSSYHRYNFLLRNTVEFLNDKLRFDFSAGYIIQKDINMMNQGYYMNPIVSAAEF